MRRRGSATLLVPLLLVLAGCGGGGSVSVQTKPKTLDGETIASRANAQLEKENPKLVPGQLKCADVALEVGATSRCLRAVVLDDGRVVRIGATVTIDRVKDGGHFAVEVDDEADEFGVAGAAVLADLKKQYAAQVGGQAPTGGDCPPYLVGKVGTTMTCALQTAGGQLAVEVTVTSVDPKNYSTEYTFQSKK